MGQKYSFNHLTQTMCIPLFKSKCAKQNKAYPHKLYKIMCYSALNIFPK